MVMGVRPLFPALRKRGQEEGHTPSRRAVSGWLTRMAGILVMALVAFATGPMAHAADHAGWPHITTPIKGTHCVRPTSYMLRNHFELLLHQREITLRDGVHGSKYDLTNCVSCHVNKDASGKYIPINAPGQFCQSCHEYAAVHIDCFSCHATTPQGPGDGNMAAR
jgi:hypothetical protein